MFRIIWQYESMVVGDLTAAALPSVAAFAARDETVYRDVPLIGGIEAVFPRPKVSLRAELMALPAPLQEDPALDLAGYHHAFVPDYEAATILVERLLNTQGVRSAEIQGRPEPPLVVDPERRTAAEALPLVSLSLQPTPTPSLLAEQGYLDPAPDGVDAHFAWTRPGGRGRGVRIIDVEYGWGFAHEDLRLIQGGILWGQPRDDDHGTAVLGVYSGDDNGLGVTGISSRAVASAVAAEYAGMKWNVEGALYAAADHLQAGDVILLEMHGPGPRTPNPPPAGSQDGFVPVEYWQVDFAAIQTVVARGIHVVEAAGNGGEDLDDGIYGGRFDRARRDSGAILVGGGAAPPSPEPRSRMSWSNYGSRLDVQGWGENVVTTGGRSRWYYRDRINHQDPSRCYTKSFSGTSSASPIVAGAVAAISGSLGAAGQLPVPPREMRQLLVETGTAQQSAPGAPITQEIGPLPNLRRALEALGLT